MRSSTERQKLLSLAGNLHITDPEQAFGRCFSASLALASMASKYGIEVNLIRWEVLNDVDFCDHWAIEFSDDETIDLTRIQVDAQVSLIHKKSEYPDNYRNPHTYPARVLLSKYERLGDSWNIRLPYWFMWESGVALAQYDIKTAITNRNLKKLASNVVRTIRFVLRSLLARLRYRFVSHH